jgi:hypothetical protein
LFCDDELIGGEDNVVVHNPDNDGTLDDSSIPAAHSRVILSALSSMHITTTHKYQVKAINKATFDSASVTVIISKTGSGKAAVPDNSPKQPEYHIRVVNGGRLK